MKSLYIHIPFCKNICSYCDFCKIYYNEKIVDDYLNELENEIKKNYKNEIIKTIYVGGGTPSSLNINQLNKLFNIIKLIKLDREYEFTFEFNPEDLTLEKIKLMKDNNVNRISIGVQTFNNKQLSFLNRNHNKKELKKGIRLLKRLGINNINVDLIYGIKDQVIKDLKKDIKEVLKLNITHISTYSLILEPNTILYINDTKEIDEDLEYKMYQYILKKLKKSKYVHYEISNFSKKGYESKHNLTYWNNNEYYGFGLGSHGYINNIRYENTRSINKYLEGKYLLNKHELTKKENIENEIMLGLRKRKGINKKEFKNKFNIDIENVFDISLLEEKDNNLFIKEKDIYIMNEILEKIFDKKND
jgi:oxygen-independent coproporphyrinogen-3 oxidase